MSKSIGVGRTLTEPSAAVSRPGKPARAHGSGPLGIALAGLLLFTLLSITSCRVAEPSVSILPQHIATLFRELSSGSREPEVQRVLLETRNAPRTDPNWPALSFLTGEAQLRGRDAEQARGTFRELA